jgi:hypothetical protein
MKFETQEIFICECYSPEHQFIIRKFDDENEVYLTIHLTKQPIWRRLKYAFRYIFGYQSRFGAFDEIILNPDDADRLQKVVDSLKINKDEQ